MDRQEAVQKLAKVARISVAYAEDLYDSFFPKPVVLQFVADWYEANKDDFETALYQEVCKSEENYEEGGLTDFQEWLIKRKNKTFQILVNMHQFGYTVEKEKRYQVKMKGITISTRYLKYNTQSANWFLSGHEEAFPYRTCHTRKELESNNFGWVFDCPGVEVKEVANED